MIRAFAVAIGVGLIMVAGCGSGSDAIPVTGQVRHQGQPVENAEVVFMPEAGRPATGVTDAEGNFTLSTFGEGDGAVAGKHTVSVSEHFGAGNAPPMPGMGEPMQSKFPAIYANPQTSGFSAEVARDSENHFVFEME